MPGYYREGVLVGRWGHLGIGKVRERCGFEFSGGDGVVLRWICGVDGGLGEVEVCKGDKKMGSNGEERKNGRAAGW